MPQESTDNPTKPLPYAAPELPLQPRPRRWWALIAWYAEIMTWVSAIPSSTPPGWPTMIDYPPMIMVPIGAIVVAATTSIPGQAIGFYGILCVLIFFPAQLGDGRYKYKFYSRWDVNIEAAKWAGLAGLSWAICRLAVFIRPAKFRD